MSGVDAPAPWRIAFDNARDPYTARNALGAEKIGGGGGGGGGAPDSAEYIVAATDATLTAERVLTNTATITWDFTTPGQAKASTAAGGGNVSNSGTPTLGQYAKWVTATTIQGVNAATVLGDIGAQPAGSYQTLDATLTALAAYNTNGLLTQTAADTFTGRTLTGPAAGITVSNGSGVAGNPTLALADDLAALEALTGTNTIYYRSGTSTWTAVNVSTGLSFSGGNLTATGGGGGGDVFQANVNTFTNDNFFAGTSKRHVIGHTAALDTTLSLESHGGRLANYNWETNANLAGLNFRKSRGGGTPNTQGLVASGDGAQVNFAASDGSAFLGYAAINAAIDGTPSAGVMPGRIQFLVRGTSGGNVEQVRISAVAGATTYLNLRGGIGQALIDAVGGGMVNIIDANLSGGPIAPTVALSDSSTKVATTAFVRTGVTNGSNAAAGVVGEYIETAASGLVGVAQNNTTTIHSITLQAGDWDVWGGFLSTVGMTAYSGCQWSIGPTAATLNAKAGCMNFGVAAGGGFIHGVAGVQRVSIAAATTLYFNFFTDGSTSASVSAILYARRAR